MIIISSLNNNNYLFDRNLRAILYISPEFKRVVELNEKLRSNSYANGDITEYNYYKKKMIFLKKHGYLQSKKYRKFEDKFLTPEEVKAQIKKIPQISIEMTEECNLSCKYCAYGELYNEYKKRVNDSFNINSFYKLFDELNRFWEESKKKEVAISFYGGEPLIEIKKIKEIVDFLKKNSKSRSFTFQMTTNGTLLKKHIDFFVKNRFNILVSLDGNKYQNEYRVFKSKKESYHTIVKCLFFIKNKYPQFFSNNIHFTSVLHNKNDINSVYKFFKDTFEKSTTISSLNTLNIRESAKQDFYKIYKPKSKPITVKNKYGKERTIRRPGDKEIKIFIEKVLRIPNGSFLRRIFDDKTIKTPAQRTCFPFAKKLFITAKGEIYPCESINRETPLGCISQKGDRDILDLEQIANTYNGLMEEYQKQCSSCYMSDFCIHCIFLVSDNMKMEKCRSYYNEKRFKEYLLTFINYFEHDHLDFQFYIFKKNLC